eukprot:4025302-Pyramimonas_sp.AAC.1
MSRRFGTCVLLGSSQGPARTSPAASVGLWGRGAVRIRSGGNIFQRAPPPRTPPHSLGIARTCAFLLRRGPSSSILDHVAKKSTHEAQENTGNA